MRVLALAEALQCVPVIRSAAARVGGKVGRAWCVSVSFGLPSHAKAPHVVSADLFVA